MAVTAQFPGCVELREKFGVVPDTEQPAVFAVPAVSAYVTTPPPDPPVVVKVTAVPAGPVVGEVEIVSALCALAGFTCGLAGFTCGFAGFACGLDLLVSGE